MRSAAFYLLERRSADSAAIRCGRTVSFAVEKTFCRKGGFRTFAADTVWLLMLDVSRPAFEIL